MCNTTTVCEKLVQYAARRGACTVVIQQGFHGFDHNSVVSTARIASTLHGQLVRKYAWYSVILRCIQPEIFHRSEKRKTSVYVKQLGAKSQALSSFVSYLSEDLTQRVW